MNKDIVFTAIVTVILGFGLGWFAGKHHERKSYDYFIQGDGWEIRAKDFDSRYYPNRNRRP